jgi:hypothetical protein
MAIRRERRGRPFISGNEHPRAFGDVLAEREPGRRDAAIRQIAELEAKAAGAEDPAVRQEIQCQAEAIRCALHEGTI